MAYIYFHLQKVQYSIIRFALFNITLRQGVQVFQKSNLVAFVNTYPNLQVHPLPITSFELNLNYQLSLELSCHCIVRTNMMWCHSNTIQKCIKLLQGLWTLCSNPQSTLNRTLAKQLLWLFEKICAYLKFKFMIILNLNILIYFYLFLLGF